MTTPFLNPYQTPKRAGEIWYCPIARVNGLEKPKAKCSGDACPLWRWRKVPGDDPRFMSAVKREIAGMLDEERKRDPKTKKTEQSFLKEATRRVATAPWDYMFTNETDRGYCGLGGEPSF